MDELSVALMSLAISTAVSFAVYLLGYEQNLRQHYSSTISNERMNWIKETRELVAKFLGFCEANKKLNKNNVHEFYQLKNQILLNLNSNENKYKNDDIIRQSLMKNSFDEIKSDLPNIRNAFIEIFKTEWDKSKLEAGRTKKQAKILDKRAKDLEEYYK